MMVHEAYDFASIMQGGLGTELYHDFLNLGYKLPASAGSDMPYAGVLGDVRVYAHVGTEEEFTPDAWFEALQQGRTFTTNGPMIEFMVDGLLPGSEIIRDDETPVLVKARAWGSSGGSAVSRLEIVFLGMSLSLVGLQRIQPKRRSSCCCHPVMEAGLRRLRMEQMVRRATRRLCM
jgi:hypothetical protein